MHHSQLKATYSQLFFFTAIDQLLNLYIFPTTKFSNSKVKLGNPAVVTIYAFRFSL